MAVRVMGILIPVRAAGRVCPDQEDQEDLEDLEVEIRACDRARSIPTASSESDGRFKVDQTTRICFDLIPQARAPLIRSPRTTTATTALTAIDPMTPA